MVPDRNGKLANVVQGHDSIEGVINSPEPFLSTLIGRYGNRIAKGKFQLGNKEYKLTINNEPNSLHGGPTGFHARVWDAEQTSKQSLTLRYLSRDGEEGFPGNLDVTVVYTFTNQNELVITYSAITEPTNGPSSLYTPRIFQSGRTCQIPLRAWKTTSSLSTQTFISPWMKFPSRPAKSLKWKELLWTSHTAHSGKPHQ